MAGPDLDGLGQGLGLALQIGGVRPELLQVRTSVSGAWAFSGVMVPSRSATRPCSVRARRSCASPNALYLARSTRVRRSQADIASSAANVGSAARGTHGSGVRTPSSNFRSAAVSAAPTTAWGPRPSVRLLTKVPRTVEDAV